MCKRVFVGGVASFPISRGVHPHEVEPSKEESNIKTVPSSFKLQEEPWEYYGWQIKMSQHRES